MTFSHVLMALAGAALGIAGAGFARDYPPKRVAVWLAVVALASSAAAGIASHVEQTPTPTPTVRPLPDPDDCVQLGWLDGAWRCITTEQAG